MALEVQRGAGETFDARTLLLRAKNSSFAERVSHFMQLLDTQFANYQSLYMRPVGSAAGREVEIIDSLTDRRRKMLMFGSNNYLGLANHPHVRDAVKKAIGKYGVGLSGPPLLNGYTTLHRQLEERLAALKHCEETLIFPTGYSANIGLMSGLTNENDLVLYDEYHHASLRDGLKVARARHEGFRHNDFDALRCQLEAGRCSASGDLFVCVEGVYSMDGDLAPLDRLVPLCRSHGAILILDDAHGTGVMGESGSGTAEHFGVQGEIDVTMGTFSKALGVVGGFVSASRPIVSYLRVLAKPYMFSASLPPVVVAAVLAGLDVIEREPWLRRQLRENVTYAAKGFRELGFQVDPQAAIIALRVPETMNIREAALKVHEAGIFVNCVEYPAVPLQDQRFRISLMATHTKKDIDRLLECTEDVWISSVGGGAPVVSDRPDAVTK